ncbi:uncharacterized protein LOC122825704 [Gambusia affinis]|uniref:uncharacterized protein LOC122825704 n=1 Tax=Gambusia affinis TaxID=33528 RepID=UPI001CDBD24B|nr:uncharacterized protein LOC122825704 [Gambusia affinis]
MKLRTQREDALTKNRRAAEVLLSNNRKIGIQADIIREQECKIVELTKEVLRLHANEQKFKMVKETYSKVQRLGLNEENGDIILLPDTDKKTEKLTMLRTENRRLSTKLKEKVTEIENLKLEEANLQNVMKCLKSKLDHVPEDVMLQVQESQTTIKALRRQKKALEAEELSTSDNTWENLPYSQSPTDPDHRMMKSLLLCSTVRSRTRRCQRTRWILGLFSFRTY